MEKKKEEKELLLSLKFKFIRKRERIKEKNL